MNHAFPWLPVICLSLCQFHSNTVLHLALVSRFHLNDVLFAGFGYCSGILLGAVAIDLIASRDIPPSLEPEPSNGE